MIGYSSRAGRRRPLVYRRRCRFRGSLAGLKMFQTSSCSEAKCLRVGRRKRRLALGSQQKEVPTIDRSANGLRGAGHFTYTRKSALVGAKIATDHPPCFPIHDK